MILKTADGSEFEAYVAGPEDAKGAVLLIHDWWGILDYNKQWADRLAVLGYLAMVIDLYDGERARTAEQAGEMMRSLDQDETDAKLSTALDYLKHDGRKLVTLGWSLGGRQALQAALLDPDAVKGVVMYYCRMLNDVEQLRELGGPVLAIYSQTERAWPEKMEKFTAAMKEAGKVVEPYRYDAGHGFVNPGSERYNAEIAEHSWEVVKGFIQKSLG